MGGTAGHASALTPAAQAGQTADQPAAQPAAPAEKKPKDTGEYEIANAVMIDLDNAKPNYPKAVTDLNTWTQKYPESDWKDDRLFFFMQAYGGLQPPQSDKVLEYGAQLEAKDLKATLKEPVNILRALYAMTASTPLLKDPTPAQLALGQKATKELQAYIPVYFAPANKAASVPDAQWAQVRAQVEHDALATLVYIAMYPGNQAYTKKDFPAAEQAFRQALKDYPDNGLIAYQLGLSMYLQKTADKSAGIYEIARGVAMDPAKGGIADAATRTAGQTYLTKVYTALHGSDEGLDQLKQLALTSPTPPPDFKIKTASEIDEEKQKQFEAQYPELAMWMKIKGMLETGDADQTFASQLKDAAMPKLKGQVMSGVPECRSKTLLVAVPEPDQKSTLTAEITLKLDAALTGKPTAGTEIVFEGAVPSAFTKDPFMLTLDIEKAKIEGLKTDLCQPTSQKKAGVGSAKKTPAKK
jgi:tetratricopeptide (TPR) repeat protein